MGYASYNGLVYGDQEVAQLAEITDEAIAILEQLWSGDYDFGQLEWDMPSLREQYDALVVTNRA